MIRAETGDRSIGDDRVGGERIDDPDVEVNAELVENQIGRHPRFEIAARVQVGEAEAPSQFRSRTPLDRGRIVSGELRGRRPNLILHAQRMDRAGAQRRLDDSKLGKRAAAEIVEGQLRHRKRCAVEPGAGDGLSQVENGIARRRPDRECDGRIRRAALCGAVE